MERSQDSFDLMESFFEALDGVNKQVAYNASEEERMEEEREEREGIIGNK